MNPTQQLHQAERGLVAAIDSVSDALEQIGTTQLDQSLSRLHTAASDCKERLAVGRSDLFATIADVVASLGGFEAELLPTPVQLTVATAANGPIEPARKPRKPKS